MKLIMKYTFKKVMIFGLGCLMGLTSCSDSWLQTDSTQTAEGDAIFLLTVFAGQWYSNMLITDRCLTVKEQ